MQANKAVTKNDFSRGPVWKNIIKQAVPLTIAQLIQLLYNVVDRVYIGHMEEGKGLALTGIGLTFPIVTLIMAFTALFGMGGVPLFSIERGRKNEEEAGKILGNSFALYISGTWRCKACNFLFFAAKSYNCGAIDVATAEGWVWREGRIYGRADF